MPPSTSSSAAPAAPPPSSCARQRPTRGLLLPALLSVWLSEGVGGPRRLNHRRLLCTGTCHSKTCMIPTRSTSATATCTPRAHSQRTSARCLDTSRARRLRRTELELRAYERLVCWQRDGRRGRRGGVEPQGDAPLREQHHHLQLREPQRLTSASLMTFRRRIAGKRGVESLTLARTVCRTMGRLRTRQASRTRARRRAARPATSPAITLSVDTRPLSGRAACVFRASCTRRSSRRASAARSRTPSTM